MEKNTTGNLPVKKFRAGAISATVWENQNKSKQGEVISYKSVSFERNYKDANGQWQKTSSLRMSDLPKAALVINKAYEFLALNNSETDDE
ncbi:MAG: hypothetical protein KKF46_01180 [Nanoarchaeota archaeon]|nr:hypothetical protein [Nanoarchaeota archaeon]MBU1320946.1 hypothetical protein [Nanoarchaeota archaeon]MBU2442083.1 hypothetical protein [Nanoarchaeota archaeon]